MGTPAYDLAVDIGCLHGLSPERRAGFAAHLIRLTHSGAIFLLYAFLPRLNRDGRPIGIDAAGLDALFGPAFAVIESTLGEDSMAPIASGWFTLQRTDLTP
jgi:hypothetical protein